MINDFINPSKFSQNKTCILKDVLCPNYVLNTCILGIEIFYMTTEKTEQGNSTYLSMLLPV